MIEEKIIEIAIKNGATSANIITSDITFEKLKTDNYPINLKRYLDNPKRININEFFKDAKSILICIYQYWHKTIDYDEIIKKIKDPYEYLFLRYKKIEYLKNIRKEKFKISRYALVEEYHKKIKEHLTKTLEDISKIIPNTNGKIFVDSSPVIEKKIAEMANLGFQARNTLLINEKYGSYIFIGGIVLNIETKNKVKIYFFNKFCNDCKICEKACPTKALKDFKLIPKRCISYWTTHSDGKNIPKEIINASDYIYGCDICQEVCPLNDKAEIDKKSIFLKKFNT